MRQGEGAILKKDPHQVFFFNHSLPRISSKTTSLTPRITRDETFLLFCNKMLPWSPDLKVPGQSKMPPKVFGVYLVPRDWTAPPRTGPPTASYSSSESYTEITDMETDHHSNKEEIQHGKHAKLGSGDSGSNPEVEAREKSTLELEQTVHPGELVPDSAQRRRSSRLFQPSTRFLEGVETSISIHFMKRLRKRRFGAYLHGREADRGTEAARKRSNVTMSYNRKGADGEAVKSIPWK